MLNLNSHLRCSGIYVFLMTCGAFAQYGSAPSNYYPDSYTGSTFTGTVTQTTDDTITLTYTHGKKTDTFEGRVTSPCNLPSSRTTTAPMSLTSVPAGSIIEAFYEEKTTKVAGHKEKKNLIIGVSYAEIEGRKVAEEHRAIFYCLPSPFPTRFKAFPGGQ